MWPGNCNANMLLCLTQPIFTVSFVTGSKIQLINILFKGLKGVKVNGESYSNAMPSQNYLTNKQLADVLTYIRNSFGNKASAVTQAEVAAARKNSKDK